MANEILIATKEKMDKVKIKVTNKEVNRWAPSKFQRIVNGKDSNELAYLFFDLNSMGYPILKAYSKFTSMLREPELFFLK